MREKYRFKLLEDFSIQTPWVNCQGEFETNWVRFLPRGILTVRRSYAWDGCSGPGGQGDLIEVPTNWPRVIDLSRPSASHMMPVTLRSSLLHDVVYQYMETFAVIGVTRKDMDDWFYDNLVTDGFDQPNLFYIAVRLFGQWYHDMNLDKIGKYVWPKYYDPTTGEYK